MAYEDGMRLGADAIKDGADYGLRLRADRRTQETHDWTQQQLREEEARQARSAAIMEESMSDPNQGQPITGPEVARTSPIRGEGEPRVGLNTSPRPVDNSMGNQAKLRMRMAAALRKPDDFMKASDTQAGLQRNQRYAEIAKRAEEGDPELLGAVNLKSMHTTVVKNKAGYDVVTVSPNGEATSHKLSKYDLGRIAMGNAMMSDGDLAGGMSLIDSVNKELGAHMKTQWEMQNGSAQTNNTATHYANSDANQSEHNRISAGQLGLQRQRLNMDRMGTAKYFNDKDGNTYASIPTMTPKGMVLETVRVNDDNVRGLTPVGQMPRDMTEQEKIAYGAATKAISELPPDSGPSQAAAVLRRYGLQPERFGYPGLPNAFATSAPKYDPGTGAIPNPLPPR